MHVFDLILSYHQALQLGGGKSPVISHTFLFRITQTNQPATLTLDSSVFAV